MVRFHAHAHTGLLAHPPIGGGRALCSSRTDEGLLAQLVEHSAYIRKVTGSSPVGSTF